MTQFRKAVVLMTMLLFLANLLIPAHAAVLEPDRTGSLTVRILDTGTHEGIPGGKVEIYRTARVVSLPDGYAYRLTERFAAADFDVSKIGELTAVQNTQQATALYAFAKAEEISPVGSAVPNEAGTTLFEGLTLGVYLVVQTEAADGYQVIDPFLVTVPQVNANAYIYDVDAAPKAGTADPTPTETVTPSTDHPDGPTDPTDPTETSSDPTESTSAPTEAPSTEPTKPTKPDKPDLPQTGQLWWPVFPLAGAGVLLFVWGLLRRKRHCHE